MMKQPIVFIATCLAFLPAIISACDVIDRNGQQVGISSESAIIIWDEKTHTERFIRRAGFVSKSQEIAFLVPTPNIPKLSAANDEAFNQLLRLTPIAPTASDAVPGAASAVIKVEHIGGYEATVLSTAHSKAIDAWLKHHGFPKTKATTQWLEPYVRKGWTVTAFKFKPKHGQAELKPVCMTFHSELPFYPYREPEAKKRPETSRSLRVFFISDQSEVAEMGEKSWVAHLDWAMPLQPQQAADLLSVLTETGFLKVPVVTSFTDMSSPRIGTDEVYFFPQKPPIVLSNIFRLYGIGIIAFWIVFGLYLFIRRQRLDEK